MHTKEPFSVIDMETWQVMMRLVKEANRMNDKTFTIGGPDFINLNVTEDSGCPPSWEKVLSPAIHKYPRGVVGALIMDVLETRQYPNMDKADLYSLVPTPYDRWEGVAPRHGADVRPDEWTWMRERFEVLLLTATRSLQLEPPGSNSCCWCNWCDAPIPLSRDNPALIMDHFKGHGLTVDRVIPGVPTLLEAPEFPWGVPV